MQLKYALLMLFFLASCSKKAILKGKREVIIQNEGDTALEDLDNSPVVYNTTEIPNSTVQFSGLFPTHAYPPLKYTMNGTLAWSTSLDYSSSSKHIVTASVVGGDNRIYCMDACGIVYALNAANGKILWKVPTTLIGKESSLGGALALHSDYLIVTTGSAHAFAINPSTGKVLWIVKLPFPSRGDSIVIDNNKAYVSCNNSSVHVIDLKTGSILKSYSGIDTREQKFIGSNSVALNDGHLYIAYPSGEISAFLEKNSMPIWSTSLNKFSLLSASKSISHPRACPVIYSGIMYITSSNGYTSAFKIQDGSLLWQAPYGGLQSPIVVGNSIYIVTMSAEIVCLNKDTGKKRWSKKISQSYPAFYWCAQILIDNNILIITPKGQAIAYSLKDGTITKSFKINTHGSKISTNPIIMNNRLFVLIDNGYIVSYQ